MNVNFFAGFDDWMEEKEPGWKAKKAAEREDREVMRLARCRELLAEYGSEDAVFALTSREDALRHALLRFSEDSVWGYRGWKTGRPTLEMWNAMRSAWPIPTTVREAWSEHQAMEKLQDDRCAFSPDYTPHEWEEAWRGALEWLLDNLRDPTAEGITARIEWLVTLANREWTRDIHHDIALATALREDFARFAKS